MWMWIVNVWGWGCLILYSWCFFKFDVYRLQRRFFMHAIKTYVLCFIYIHLLFLSFFSAKHTCKSKCLRSFVHLFVATTLKTKVWWMMTCDELMKWWPDDQMTITTWGCHVSVAAVLYCTVLYCTVLYCNVRLSCECGCWTAINRSLIRALSRLPGCGWWRGRYYTPDHILSAARHINVNWSQAGNTNLQYSIFHYNTGLLTTGGSPVPHAK